MTILVTAKWRAFTNALNPVVRELEHRGHDVEIIATGNETEARGFEPLHYKITHLETKDAPSLDKYSVVVTGMSGIYPDNMFLKAAKEGKKPSFALMDQDNHFAERIDWSALPSILGVVSHHSFHGLAHLEHRSAGELATRARYVGFPAFDAYAEIRDSFTSEDREDLLVRLGADPSKDYHVHFSQNIHPDSKYMKQVERPHDVKQREFEYELRVTTSVLRFGRLMGKTMLVKPHPGEEYCTDYTRKMADQYQHIYVPSGVCTSQELILASSGVSAGRSNVLNEACLLDKNTVAIVPEQNAEGIAAIANHAIPSADSWCKIESRLELMLLNGQLANKVLAGQRKRFYVDGKASKRAADYIESLL